MSFVSNVYEEVMSNPRYKMIIVVLTIAIAATIIYSNPGDDAATGNTNLIMTQFNRIALPAFLTSLMASSLASNPDNDVPQLVSDTSVPTMNVDVLPTMDIPVMTIGEDIKEDIQVLAPF